MDWDRFAYVRGNPVKYTDPSGHSVACGTDSGNGCEGRYGNNTPLTKSVLNQSSEELPAQKKDPDNRMPNENQYFLEPADGPEKYDQGSVLEELLSYGLFYKYSAEITEVIEYIDKYGRPAYRKIKGSLPGGPVLEFFLGSSTQLARDLNDDTLIRSGNDLVQRALIVGTEDAITEAISTPVGTTLAPVGEICGPVMPLCIGIAYLASANATNWIMDEIFWKQVNSDMGIYR